MSAVDSAKDTVSTDRFLTWEHLVLVLTPFPFFIVSKASWILGWNNDAADYVAGFWIWPAFMLYWTTGLVIPILLAVLLLFFIGRNLWRRRVKRLALYVLILVALPIALATVDADYLRFKLQERKIDARLAEKIAMEKTDAGCSEIVLDIIQDNFYLGGANFSPYAKVLVHVAPNATDQCESLKYLRNVRRLTDKYYLAERDMGGG